MTAARAGVTHPEKSGKYHKDVREHLQGQTLSHAKEAKAKSYSPAGDSASWGTLRLAPGFHSAFLHIPENMGFLPLLQELDPGFPQAIFYFVHLASLPRSANVGDAGLKTFLLGMEKYPTAPSFPIVPSSPGCPQPRPIPSHPLKAFLQASLSAFLLSGSLFPTPQLQPGAAGTGKASVRAPRGT